MLEPKENLEEIKVVDQFDNNVVFLFGLLVFVGLVVTSFYNYLLFHTSFEMFSIIIACSVFILVWNTRLLTGNNFLLFLGIASLFIGVIDLVHTLTYFGMNIFPIIEANEPTQLWIAARYLQAISLLLALVFLKRKFNTPLVFVIYFSITSLLFIFIFYYPIFPDAFIAGSGLTPFKKISEYIISGFLLLFIFLLRKNRQRFSPEVLKGLFLFGIASIISEIAFTFYLSVYGFSNLVGHIFKVLAFYFLYVAIIKNSLLKPYANLFGDLKQKIQQLEYINAVSSKEVGEYKELRAKIRGVLKK